MQPVRVIQWPDLYERTAYAAFSQPRGRHYPLHDPVLLKKLDAYPGQDKTARLGVGLQAAAAAEAANVLVLQVPPSGQAAHRQFQGVARSQSSQKHQVRCNFDQDIDIRAFCLPCPASRRRHWRRDNPRSWTKPETPHLTTFVSIKYAGIFPAAIPAPTPAKSRFPIDFSIKYP